MAPFRQLPAAIGCRRIEEGPDPERNTKRPADYDDLPKGNCDLFGDYFAWLASPEGRRDLFTVHLPRR
jgi:hypothetical protein